MPNPLMRLGSRNQSNSDPVEHPTAVVPVPERVQGNVFAYRGMEEHGVPSTLEWRDPEQYDGYERGVEVALEPVDEGPDPIPVYIVDTQEKGRQVIRGRIYHAYATGSTKGTNASNVISADFQGRRRVKVKVKNLATTTVWLGFTADTANTMSGWPLAQNETFEHAGEESIWATGTGADDSALAVAVEYATVIPEHGDRD